MPTIAIDLGNGGTQHVQVDASFTDLPPAKQAAEVDEIKQHLLQGQQQDRSFLGATRYGAAAPLRGAADTADVAGASGVGNALRSGADYIAPPNYSPAAPEVTKNLRQGNYGEAASYAPRAIAEGLGSGLGVIGAGAAGGAVGGLPGAVAGAAGAAAGMSYGPNVKARQAAGDTNPYVTAIPGTAAETALNTLGSAAGPIGGALMRPVTPLLRPAARVALDAAGTAGADVAHQVGTTAGTPQGVTVDPYEAATSGIQGAGARGLVEGRAGLSGLPNPVRGLGDAITRSSLPRIEDPETNASFVRVSQDAEKASAAAVASGTRLSDTQIINNLKKTYAAAVDVYARKLLDQGHITDEEYRLYVRPAIAQASVHNAALTDGPGTAFGELQQLPLRSEHLDPLVNGVRDLNTVSNQSLIKNTRGPFQTGGSILGSLGSIGAGLLSGNVPLEVAGGLLGFGGGHSIAGRIGGGIGAAIDRMAGTNTPPILLQAQRARRALEQANIAAGTPSTQNLYGAIARMPEVDSNTLATQLGFLGHQAAQYMPRPDLNLNMKPAQVNALPQMQQAHLADMAGLTLDQLRQSAQQGLTPKQAAQGVNRTERSSDQVLGMGYRADMAMPAQVQQANFVNTGGDAGMPVGRPTVQMPAALPPPATPHPLNDTAAARADLGVTQATNTAVNQAFQEANTQMAGIPGVGTQQRATQHASQMAFSAARNARVVADVVNNGHAATSRPNVAAGAEMKSPTQSDTGDQMGANGGHQAPDVIAGAKATAAATKVQTGDVTRGWKSYVRRGLTDHGVPTDVSDIHAAVDHLAANGGLHDFAPEGMGPQAVAARLKGYNGSLRGPQGQEVIRRVLSQVAANKGMSHVLDTEATNSTQAPLADEPSPDRGPVRSPPRYNAAVQGYANAVGGAATQLAHQGMHPTAALVSSFTAPHMARGADKEAALDAHMASLPEPHRKVAEAILKPVRKTILKGIK